MELQDQWGDTNLHSMYFTTPTHYTTSICMAGVHSSSTADSQVSSVKDGEKLPSAMMVLAMRTDR